MSRWFRVLGLIALAFTLLAIGNNPAPGVSAAGPGVGIVPQGTQSDATYAASFKTKNVGNVFATTQKTSCYRPEVPFFVSNAPNNGYSGMSACTGATTGEDIGTSPYATQVGSNLGYPANNSMLVKDHSESDIRIDPTNPNHLIGSSKWVVSPEGYNHLLGFYESFDGGKTWPVQGHIPGYEGWTDNTDPVGAFDSYGNYYALLLPYQFFYKPDTSHAFTVGTVQEPNPNVPAEVIAVSVRPHGATSATQWITTHNGQPDYVSTTDSKGNEPDKQWITIDTKTNTIYAMWVVFNGVSSKPFVSTAIALRDGTHTDWTTPVLLPTLNSTASDTFLLPHVDPAGVAYTTVVNFPSKQQRAFANIGIDFSTDGGKTWQGPLVVTQNFVMTPLLYANTTFRSGILNTFGIGTQKSAQDHYPLYVSYEDYSAGVANIILTASYDGGNTWSTPIQVNDNASAVDELQPSLNVAPNGTVSVAFYDRRLTCPASGSAEATGAGLALDTLNPHWAGALPPYGAANYCVNASVQFYAADLTPKGHNIRLTQNSFDPQLNAPQPSRATNLGYTFIGDYFGNIASSTTNYFTFVSTFDDGLKPTYRQQQIVASVALP